MSTYAERAAPAWIAGPVACVWRTVSTGNGTVLPDACVDLIHVQGRGAFVAGPDTAPVRWPVIPARSVVTGLRLRPGHAGAALGLPADELRDQRVDLADVWGREGAELAARLDDAADTGERHALMAAAVARRAARPDPLVLQAVALLAHRPDRRVAEVAAALAVSERHLLRRLRGAVGYGPKTLARILRFQRLLALAERRADSLAELALAAGYADQPHMTGEVTRLAGAPPTTVLGVASARGDVELVRSLQDGRSHAA
jgi:methylphosphotriester-DNA--protein-cysteine methyltransferase